MRQTLATRITRYLKRHTEATPKDIAKALRANRSSVTKQLTRMRRKGTIAPSDRTGKARPIGAAKVEVKQAGWQWLAERLAIGRNDANTVLLIIRDEYPGGAATIADQERILAGLVASSGKALIDARPSEQCIIKTVGAQHWVHQTIRSIKDIGNGYQIAESYDGRVGRYRAVLRTPYLRLRIVDVESGGENVPGAFAVQHHLSGGSHWYMERLTRIPTVKGYDKGYEALSRIRGYYHEFLADSYGSIHSAPYAIGFSTQLAAEHIAAWHAAVIAARREGMIT
jgi:hypothetical protein